jgi:flagellar M-ring protein FliF
VNGILEIVNKLGPQRLVAMGAVTLALVGFFAFVMTKMSTPGMGVLFSDLPIQDSNAIIRDLETKGIKFEMRQDGSTILVPRDMATRLRMEFAGKGLPAGGSVGYEIFDKSDGFSATSFVQGINPRRALEGELARTIKGLDRVQQARVHLAIPEKKLFQRDAPEARASIVLKVRGELDPGQIRAIRHLGATAVQGLKPERVSIVDETGRLLADGAGNETDVAAIAQDKQSGYERRMRSQVEDIVASVVGRGRARVQVAAEMDFNRIQQVTDNFDPESRVVRSTQTRTEQQQSQEARDNQVTVANELPQNQQNQQQAQQRDQTQRNEEIINYEISKTTRTEVIEAGRVKRLSVAVLVDGVYTTGQNGQVTYAPRNAEELERIAALVRSAIGFDRNRGDQVEVINLRFAEGTAAGQPAQSQGLVEQLLALTKEDALRMVELGVFGVLTLLVTLLVVRPLLRQMGIGGKDKKDDTGSNIPQISGLGSVIANSAIANQPPGGAPLALPAPAGEGSLVPANSNAQAAANQAAIQQALHQSAVDHLGKIVQDNPSESVAIVRQWIAQTR